MKIIAIPQNLDMQKDYEDGWDINEDIIKEKNLILDEIFEVYVDKSNKTPYINIEDNLFNELNHYGIWKQLNSFSTFGSIEEYEEGDIGNPKKLQESYNYLKSINTDDFSESSKELIRNIIILTEKALEDGLSLYFFF